MATIVQGPPSIGERLGTGLGSGLAQGISALAQSKMQELAQRQSRSHEAAAYQKLGISPEEAHALTYLPEKTKGSLIQAYLTSPRQQQEPETGLEALMQPQANIEQERMLPKIDLNNADILQLMGQTALPEYEGPGLRSSRIPSVQESQQMVQEQQLVKPSIEAKQQELQLTKAQQAAKQQQMAEHKASKQSKQESLRDVLSRMETPAQRKEKVAAQKESNRETKPIYDKIVADKDFADFSDSRITKMENLVKKGGLPFSSLYRVFKNIEEHAPTAYAAPAGAAAGFALGGPLGAAIGGGLGALISPVATVLQSVQNKTSPDSEEFAKLSNEFIRGAKALFGNRITNDDLKAYLATLPTLANTDQGKLAIIKNMRIGNKVAKVKYNTMKQIIKENNGERPADLLFQVEERAKPQIDKLVEQFVTV